MPSKELTEEEIRIIMENPYTLNVSRNKFMLTKEGKEKVLILAESGKTIRQIMIELGYITFYCCFLLSQFRLSLTWGVL